MGSDAPLVDIAEEDIVDFETVVMKIPQYDTENPQMISQGPSICVFNKDDPQEVLASWLFAQYLLTNEVQYAYATTEGYVPVTIKAQQSEAYQDYLSRAGEDDDFYYQIKMDATNLLLDNIENTFVTPVFNGSTDLRNAAGQLIEKVVVDAHNKKPINDAYFENLFDEIAALYRLDQIQTNGSWKQELGPLPQTAVILLCVLAATWVILGILALHQNKKAKKQ
jgi:multiple sugar transport system substrate-binding protein